MLYELILIESLIDLMSCVLYICLLVCKAERITGNSEGELCAKTLVYNLLVLFRVMYVCFCFVL